MSVDVGHVSVLPSRLATENRIIQGIPRGLGAGFKIIDREKDRDAGRESRHKEEAKDPHDGVGWTAMIEDWLCHGVRYTSPTPSEISLPKPLAARSTAKERKGPYQLLIKGFCIIQKNLDSCSHSFQNG